MYVAVVSFDKRTYSVGEIEQHLKVDLILNKPLSTDVTVKMLTDSGNANVGKLTVVCI